MDIGHPQGWTIQLEEDSMRKKMVFLCLYWLVIKAGQRLQPLILSHPEKMLLLAASLLTHSNCLDATVKKLIMV